MKSKLFRKLNTSISSMPSQGISTPFSPMLLDIALWRTLFLAPHMLWMALLGMWRQHHQHIPLPVHMYHHIKEWAHRDHPHLQHGHIRTLLCSHQLQTLQVDLMTQLPSISRGHLTIPPPITPTTHFQIRKDLPWLICHTPVLTSSNQHLPSRHRPLSN